MDDSPKSGTTYRFDLIFNTKPLIVWVRLADDSELEIVRVEGPPIAREDLLRLLKTSILPRVA